MKKTLGASKALFLRQQLAYLPESSEWKTLNKIYISVYKNNLYNTAISFILSARQKAGSQGKSAVYQLHQRNKKELLQACVTKDQ